MINGTWTIKTYYNREKIIRIVSLILFSVPMVLAILTILNGETILTISVMAFFTLLLLYLSLEIQDIESLSFIEVVNVFWLNRHTIEKQKIIERPKAFIFCCFIAINIIWLNFKLVFMLGVQWFPYGLIALSTSLLIFLNDLVFHISNQYEQIDEEK